jgi:hypothetical protein
MDPFLYYCALEFRKNTEHLKQRTACRRRSIDGLLFQIEITPGIIELAKKANEILQRSAKPVDRPRGNDIDLPAHVTAPHSDSTP